VFHVESEGVGCSTCHGSGYDATRQTVNTSTHQDRKLQLARKLHWDTATHSCAPSCHGTKTWTSTSGGSSGGGDRGGGGEHGEEIVIVDDGELEAGGCSSAGGTVNVLALIGLAVLAIRRQRRAHRQA
jgi:hypothetical protein